MGGSRKDANRLVETDGGGLSARRSGTNHHSNALHCCFTVFGFSFGRIKRVDTVKCELSNSNEVIGMTKWRVDRWCHNFELGALGCALLQSRTDGRVPEFAVFSLGDRMPPRPIKNCKNSCRAPW